jgi:hypothetical protein
LLRFIAVSNSKKYHAVVSRKKLLLVTLLSIAVFLCLIAWSPWNARRYKGDGKFSDGGFFSYPRYVVRFPDMPLYEPGEYRFRFQGLPSEEMTLLLYVKGSSGSEEERNRLTKLSAVIDAKLTDSHGRDVCHASGRPKNSNEDGIWVLRSGGDAAFWHWQCRDVQFRSAESYSLLIHVIGPDQTANGVVVTPMFQGGGLELP